MGAGAGSLDYFRGVGANIFDAIENAILVAAADFPAEFRDRRGRIAELLFSSPGCLRCLRETQVVSNYSYDEAEALTEVIEEEGQTLGEVLRIKELLSDGKDQSEAVLFESLRRLQLMRLSLETLKATEVGKPVKGLRKHHSKRISSLAQNLVDEWKSLVDEFVKSVVVLPEPTPESADPATFEMDEGLSSPPLDGFFLATQTTSVEELSKFFDGMNEDGSAVPQCDSRFTGEFNKIDKQERIMGNCNLKNQNPSRFSSEFSDDDGDNDDDHLGIQDALRTTNKHNQHKEFENGCGRQPKVSNRSSDSKGSLQKQPKGSDPGRNFKSCVNHQTVDDTKPQMQSRCDVYKKPMTASHNKNLEGKPNQTKLEISKRKLHEGYQQVQKNLEEKPNQTKLEISRRKLHEGYQQAENAKKQRTVQVMELTDLPKQPVIHKPSHVKAGIRGRKWVNSRRQS